MSETLELTISAGRIATILVRARQFDVKDVVTEPDPGSNASDDGMLSVLEDHTDDPVRSELIAMIRGLKMSKDLVALAWLGCGDGDLDAWQDLRAEAARAHNKRTAEYHPGMPLLGDYLEEALSQFGHSTEAFDEPV